MYLYITHHMCVKSDIGNIHMPSLPSSRCVSLSALVSSNCRPMALSFAGEDKIALQNKAGREENRAETSKIELSSLVGYLGRLFGLA